MYPIDFFWRAVRTYPDSPAVIGPNATLTFAELGRRVAARAVTINAWASKPEDRVGIAAGNSFEHLEAILAVLAAGRIWVPLNPRNGDPELLRQIEFAGPAVVLADEEMAQRLRASVASVRLLDETSAGVDEGDALPSRPRPLDRTQAIKFTGGSTGAPKGVRQPLRAWNANIITQTYSLRLESTDRYLVAAPLTHGTSTYLLPVLGNGGALVFPEAPKPAAMLEAAEQHRASLFFAPPTLIVAMIEEQRRSTRDLRALRHLVYGGAPMRTEQIRAAQECFGQVVCTSYGQTEAPQIATFLPADGMRGDDILSVGKATLMTEVLIVDPDGRTLPAGEQGEIAIRGDLVMSGYLDAPEETAKVLDRGLLRTGDSGSIDTRGMLFLKDRIRDVIITGGFNVYPGDVEAVVLGEPDILHCSVVGIPDPKWGEAVHLAVELRPGSSLDEAALLRSIRAALGPVKTPKRVHVFEELPRSPVGKLLKPALRDAIVALEEAEMVS